MERIPVIFLRTSTDQQNPENQLEDCQRLNIFGNALILEEKQSAWKDNKERPELEKLKKMIIAGQVSHLIIWDFDRLFRNREKFKQFLQLLKAYNVQLHSVRQQWMEEINKVPSPWNEIVYEMLINVFGWLAEEESSKKSDRVKIAFRSHKGEKWGRPSIPEKACLEVVKLFQEGRSISQISSEVTYWNKHGNKKNLSRGIVHKIIKEFKEQKPSFEMDSNKERLLNDQIVEGGEANGERS